MWAGRRGRSVMSVELTVKDGRHAWDRVGQFVPIQPGARARDRGGVIEHALALLEHDGLGAEPHHNTSLEP